MGIVDDIKRDREAGTPGAWAHKSHMDIAPTGGDADDIIASLYADTPNADARRIARVPQLEAIALAAEELADVLAGWEATGCPICAGDCAAANPPVFSCIMQATSSALTAYRKATEAAK